MDRDDYRDKLLDENVRKRELQKNIGQSTAQDMISRQVDGGIDQSELTRTLVDGRAEDATLVTQKNTSPDGHEMDFGTQDVVTPQTVIDGVVVQVSDEEEGEESALYQKGGNANSFESNDREYQLSYRGPRSRSKPSDATKDNKDISHDEEVIPSRKNVAAREQARRKGKKDAGKFEGKASARSERTASERDKAATRKGRPKKEPVETVGAGTIKERERKRKLEEKTSDAGYDKSRRVKKEDTKYASSKEEVPNRSKAREADEEDARRYQEVIYKKRKTGDKVEPASKRKRNQQRTADRKHKYISAVEDEPAGKFSKKISGKKGRDKSKRRKKVGDVPEELVMKKVREGADENYGIEASERAIYAARYGKKAASDGGKFVKSATRTVRDAGEKAASGITTKGDLLRQQRNIEAKYKAARRKGQTIKEAMVEAKEVTIKIAHKAQEIIRKNLTLIISIASVLILIVAVSATISSCASALSQGAGTYIGGLCPTTDREMTDCDSYMDELENDLQETIDNIETDYPDYDEYDYDLAEIGHDYTVLMAFLSAEYADYSLADIQAVIDTLFDEMYTLTIWETEELRTKEELNPDTGDYEEVEYMAKILHIKLEKKELSEVVENKFSDDDSKNRYENYITTGGAHQVYANPFDFNWTGDVSSPFGWRIHPISKERKFHNGLDIAEPGGTPVRSVCTGTVINSYFSSSAGNYIIVQDVTGYTVHYMHLNDRYVAAGTEIKRGDLIGTVGTTGNSTGNHLHIGVKDESGEWLNPSFLVSSFVEP